jgi:hypothetical protein
MEIELADAVAALRDELLTAAARGVSPDLAFAVGPVELEFAVELRTDARAKAGFKAWVVSADAEAGVARAQTHRVTLTLKPQRRDGGDLMVSGAPGRPEGPGDSSGRIPD